MHRFGLFYLLNERCKHTVSSMVDSCPKKPKIMPPCAPRIRCSIQIEVEPGMDGRLEQLKSRIHHAKSALVITSNSTGQSFDDGMIAECI